MTYQPFKTCPLCGQRCVLDMKTCQRCGYVYPCPPAPYYAPLPAILPSIEKARPPTTVLRWAAALAVVFCAVVLLTLVANRATSPSFAGTWHSRYGGTISFLPDGRFEGRPPGLSAGTGGLTWRKAGPLIQIDMKGSFIGADVLPYQWVMSDDGETLTLSGGPGMTETYWRRPPRF